MIQNKMVAAARARATSSVPAARAKAMGSSPGATKSTSVAKPKGSTSKSGGDWKERLMGQYKARGGKSTKDETNEWARLDAKDRAAKTVRGGASAPAKTGTPKSKSAKLTGLAKKEAKTEKKSLKQKMKDKMKDKY